MKTNDQNKKTEFISIRVSKEIKHRLEKKAQQEERSLSWVVAKILDGYFNK